MENISVIIVTYNHKEHIKKCLDSIFKNDKNLDVIIVDNNSIDGTPDLIKDAFPEVNLVKNPQNSGYGSAVNLGVKYSKKEYIVILNPDVTVETNFIEELVKPITKNKYLVTTPKALLYDGSKINTCGNIEHFTGLAFTLGLGKDKEELSDSKFISGLSGVCFAITRSLYLEIGGFDENIFLYMEDTEISWNINSRGLKILYVPSAVIYHDYELVVHAEKIYYLEKGRYIILKKYFTWKEYLMFAPSLIIAELFTVGYSLLKGTEGFKFKMQAIKDSVNSDVEKVECNRRELINSFEWKMPEGQLSYNFLDRFVRKLGNLIFFINYNLIRTLCQLRSQDIEILDIQEGKLDEYPVALITETTDKKMGK